ncbi:DHA1 family inner membrane transport protein [Sphingomonas aurantiaca]|uniref:DHA1 family inner membrane transport protein n=1 Tax=Sphingomonas aurantiaca TaxID=185949 RepID=A0A2T5GSG4_9SPHN|nr:MFS transporter [Sphingomonas aurantiaca]PTQ62235.1 DHA1 family inner membrane transport protein [Sphingomonas aurantiaca]
MIDSYGLTTVNPRLALLALAVGGFAIGTTEFAAMSLLPQFARGLGIDEPTAGHVISAYALGVVVGAPTIAVLAAKIERRVLLIGLMTFLGIANGLSALAPTYHLMLLARFLSGLPHGAYFGVGSLVAASMVPREKRSRAVSRMMLGLTIATIAGVPLANGIGQWFGWRWGFGIVAIIAAATVAMLVRFAPILRPAKDASPLGELAALRNGQVWLTLAIGAVGFGGIFCVYTYLASTLTEVTGVSSAFTPVAFALFGVGMTIGTLVCAKAADVALMPAAGITLLFGAGALALYAPAAPHLWAILPVVVLIGCGGGLSTILQTRLMDVAEEAQTLAAALNHSAFNTANAIGPWLGGLAIAGGFGLPSTGWVGTALALGGFAIWALSWALDRRRA